MTDEVLIRNACKAAGWRIKKIGLPENSGSTCVWIDDAPVIVKLADDDGDSRMLQVACKIGMAWWKRKGAECVSAIDKMCEHESVEPLGTDAKKSARMAVLRCAGAIGESME